MERRKKRIVKLTAFLFLLAASIFVMPQKAFADENEDVTLPTGDIKPMEPQQDESGIDTYGADEGDEFSGTEYELYTVLENRVKEAMLAGNEWVSIKDLKVSEIHLHKKIMLCIIAQSRIFMNIHWKTILKQLL